MASRAAPAAAMSLAACSSCSSITSLPASSGSVVSFPRYRSGATATNPWAARRSATSRMWGTRPHHSWMTTTPGPLPEGGREIYAGTASPLTGISVIEPAMSWPSWIVLAPGYGLILARLPRLDHSGRSSDARQGPTRSRGACRGRAPGGGGRLTSMMAWLEALVAAKGVGSAPQGGVPPRMRVDTDDFTIAMRAAMRQDPDVILVGEIRDAETLKNALAAAETGHLVLSTLHTTDAAETINRCIDLFPPFQQRQVRLSLAAALRGIVGQRLVRRSGDGGRGALLWGIV